MLRKLLTGESSAERQSRLAVIAAQKAAKREAARKAGERLWFKVKLAIYVPLGLFISLVLFVAIFQKPSTESEAEKAWEAKYHKEIVHHKDGSTTIRNEAKKKK